MPVKPFLTDRPEKAARAPSTRPRDLGRPEKDQAVLHDPSRTAGPGRPKRLEVKYEERFKHLLAKGWEDIIPVTVPRGKIARGGALTHTAMGKAPGLMGENREWRGYAKFLESECTVERAGVWDKWDANIGCVGRSVVGIDIDLEDNASVSLALGVVRKVLGDGGIQWIRRGKKGILIPVRLADVERGSWNTRRVLWEKDGEPLGGLDLIGANGQWLVHGRHPAGGLYRWGGFDLSGNRKAWSSDTAAVPGVDQLVTVSRLTLEKLLTELVGTIEAKTGRVLRGKVGKQTSIAGPGAGTRQRSVTAGGNVGVILGAPSQTALELVMTLLPNADDTTPFKMREEWIGVGEALRCATMDGGMEERVGLEIWLQWCAQYSLNEMEDCAKQWARMKGPWRAGYSWLREQALRWGDQDPDAYTLGKADDGDGRGLWQRVNDARADETFAAMGLVKREVVERQKRELGEYMEEEVEGDAERLEEIKGAISESGGGKDTPETLDLSNVVSLDKARKEQQQKINAPKVGTDDEVSEAEAKRQRNCLFALMADVTYVVSPEVWKHHPSGRDYTARELNSAWAGSCGFPVESKAAKNPDLATWWRAAPDVRHVAKGSVLKCDTMTYAPGKGRIVIEGAHRKMLNLWEAPDVDLMPHLSTRELRAKIGKWLALVAHVVGRTNGTKMLDWMTCTLAHPEVKPAWAPVVVGLPGIGKDLMFRPLAAGVGFKNWSEIGYETLREKYTDWADAKKVVVLQELWKGKEAKEVQEKLKTLIAPTSTSTILVRKMYMKSYAIPNVINFLILTNNADALALTAGERRYWVLHEGNRPLASDFYVDMMRWYEKEGGLALVCAYLMRRKVDLKQFEIVAERTDAYEDMEDMSKTRLALWLEEKFAEGGERPWGRELFELGALPLPQQFRGASLHMVGKALREIGAVPVTGLEGREGYQRRGVRLRLEGWQGPQVRIWCAPAANAKRWNVMYHKQEGVFLKRYLNDVEGKVVPPWKRGK